MDLFDLNSSVTSLNTSLGSVISSESSAALDVSSLERESQYPEQRRSEGRLVLSSNILVVEDGACTIRKLKVEPTLDDSTGAMCSPSSLSALGARRSYSPEPSGKFSLARQMLDYISQTFKQGRFSHSDPERLGRSVIEICSQASVLLNSESIFLRLKSPICVLGDIHGNFADLFFHVNQLLPFGEIECSASNFLFLGDYVDRGEFSVEVAMYLFSMKLLSPSTVSLLRGNHELFVVNGDTDHYGEGSFKNQCSRLFGCNLGSDVWIAINDVFKLLPLAATIDDKIFCAHGGIPRYSGGQDVRLRILSDPYFPRFNSVHPQPNDSPQRQLYRALAMDLLWSDPAEDESTLDQFGFGPNARGPNTVTFGRKAIETLLANHGFEFIIRAHELQRHGLRVAKNARVLTVFTSSGYCGGDNASGVVFIANGTIRMITSQCSRKTAPFRGPIPSPSMTVADARSSSLGNAVPVAPRAVYSRSPEATAYVQSDPPRSSLRGSSPSLSFSLGGSRCARPPSPSLTSSHSRAPDALARRRPKAPPTRARSACAVGKA
eukprot:NODE_332_length_2443_cov_14.588972_g307_i0.p1 GENE.NODE_332_length_2443_cov_14.588972_g307_i0~~NODE_332_length_2443_cov_14.588972_g307_i0.p1  ORF type:complete len:571 (+),score=59.06 NODE_332_length_2443_cov_14.588972_g307_i0:69-1715(+)